MAQMAGGRIVVAASGRLKGTVLTEKQLQEIFTRQDEIMRHRVVCRNCGETKQVQIIDKQRPAQWKCRMCKTEFYSEPRP